MEAYTITECPNCGINVARNAQNGDQQVICNIKNEGGLQEGLDILPLLAEESYLKAFPEERRCRAYLEFCGEGDVEAIINLLQDDDDYDDGDEEPGDTVKSEAKNVDPLERIDVLRYQDPMGSMSSGLHVAIANKRIEVVWLLLLLASTLALAQFPPEILEAAGQWKVARENQSGKVDIRTLKDGEGTTAAERATAAGDFWNDWLTSGRLTAGL